MKTIVTILVLLSLFNACKEGHKETAKHDATASIKVAETDLVQLTDIQLKNAGITIGMIETREMNSVLKVNGIVEAPPENVVSISIPIAGYLKKTNLIKGMKVNKGTLLATLEDQQYIQIQQDYLSAKARLEYTLDDYNRQKALNENKTVSDKVFQQSKAEFMTQKILAMALAEKLRLIGIDPESINENNISRSIYLYAPINGYVTKVNVNTGKYVSPSDVMFELISPNDLHLSLTVFENDASNIAIGQKITCTTNQGAEKYTATVHFITPSIDNDHATEVHCDLEGNIKKLLPGTFMNAEIAMNKAKVTAVPEDAVVKWQNHYFVFAQEDVNSFRMIPIETGVANNGFIEIRSNLPAKKIITKNAYTVLMKMKNNSGEM